MKYESTERYESSSYPGVWFRVCRMSLGRRLSLSTVIGKLLKQLEFSGAGKDLQDHVESARIGLEIEQTYIRWGLVEVGGLEIDNSAADVTAVLERGPEPLIREILSAVRHQCGLSDEERKN